MNVLDWLQRLLPSRGAGVEREFARENLLATLAETTSSAIFVYREHFLYANRATEQITGCSREELVTMHFWDVVHPDQRQLVRKRGLIRLRGGTVPNHYIIKLLRKDGTVRWVDFVAHAVQLGGQVAGLGTAFDITPLKETEAKLQQAVNNLSALFHSSRQLLEITTTQDAMEKACQEAVEQFGVKMAWIGVVRPGDFKVYPVAIAGAEEGYTQSIHVTWGDMATGQGPTGVAIREKKPVAQNYIDTDPAYEPWRAAALSRGYRSSLALPLLYGEKVLGTINLYSEQPAYFSEETLPTFQAFANLVAIAFQRGDLFEKEAKRRQTAETLQGIAIALGSTLELKPLLDLILTRLASVVPYDSTAILLREEKGLRVVAGHGFPRPDQILDYLLPLEEDELFHTIKQTQRPLWLADAQANPIFHKYGGTDYVHGWLGVPLIGQGEVIGVLTLDSRQFDAYGAEEAEVVQIFAQQAAQAIANAKLYEQLRQQAAQLEERVTEQTIALKNRVVEVEQLNQGMIKLLYDVQTAYRQATIMTKRLQDTNAVLEEFTYTASHDLRAPLRAIQGFAEFLWEDNAAKLDPAGQDYLQRILNAAQRMDQLIVDLLAYSRLAREELPIQPLDLMTVTQRVLLDLDGEIQAKHATVDVQQPLLSVLGHETTLEQVVLNLVENALKFGPPGGQPRVRIWTEKIGGQVRLWVEDNGIGIPLEHQERIFRVFERLHRQEEYPGTGIGLASVKKGVERMGGRVGVESEVGKGSRFWVELPPA